MSWLKHWKRRRGGQRPRLPKTMNQQEAKPLLESIGYKQVDSGKHQIKMNKPGVLRPIVLSHHHGQQYSRDLTARILKEAGLLGAEGSDHGE